jgi:hypothetical protein
MDSSISATCLANKELSKKAESSVNVQLIVWIVIKNKISSILKKRAAPLLVLNYLRGGNAL